MNTKHILLVEDDPRDVELTLAALKDHDLANKVFVVHDGAEALDYLYCRGTFRARAGGNPVVVLLDNKMPKVSGLEVLKAIKANPRLKVIPIVALTSSRETPDLIEFYKHGANAYVVKPVKYPEFVQAVKQLGAFWGTVNEPPPPTGDEATGVQRGPETVPACGAEANDAAGQTPPGTMSAPQPMPHPAARRRPGPKEFKHEIPAPHPAPGG